VRRRAEAVLLLDRDGERRARPATASVVASALYVLRNGERFHQGEITDDAAVGVRAQDDLTLEVELERPAPYFLDIISFPTLAPLRKDVIEPFVQRGEAELWTRPSGAEAGFSPRRAGEHLFNA
jgi:ABC-type oligopeptide transport system substrate-binding subunit